MKKGDRLLFQDGNEGPVKIIKMGKSSLSPFLASLPQKPGIYFFKNASQEVIYIGKARSLRDRVKTYFLPNADYKVRNILSETASIDYVLADSEKEANFLENNYIQQYQPKFNLRLKDDKSFPYLRLTLREPYPGVYFSRKPKPDGASYFGPFSPANQARKSIRLVAKYFGIRTCENRVFRSRKRPCLEYDLKLCSAPCVGLITEEAYRENASSARLFLDGHSKELLPVLRRRMEEAAEAQNFEEAAHWRDLIRTVKEIKLRPKMISISGGDLDVIGFARKGGSVALYVFFMRGGKVRDSREVHVQGGGDIREEKILGDFLGSFYLDKTDIPPKILLPFAVSGEELLSRSLSSKAGRKVRIAGPAAGKNRQLIELANRNAESAIEKRRTEAAPEIELSNFLGLKKTASRIEGFDVSNTGGDESVGSVVVFRDGKPDRNEYRKYRIQTIQGPNDVGSLEEIITRRYRRMLEENRALPDLVLIDGGLGQLGAARKALEKLGLKDLAVITLAKREETIFSDSHPEGIRLERTSPALKLIQHIRDEAHRFAVTFHRRRREKKSFASGLDGIPGLGPKKKSLLLAKYKGIEEIRKAPAAELATLVGEKTAEKLLQALS